MSSLLLHQDAINVDVEPASFDAFSLNPFGMKVSKFTLELDRDGLKLVNKKGNVISTAAWYELEELKNEIREKGRFSYFGTLQTSLNDVRVVIKVNVDDGERERLAKIFDKLPQDVFGRKCPDCGGSVVDNICKNCGQSFTGQQRRKGVKLILGGSVLLLAGISLELSDVQFVEWFNVAFLWTDSVRRRFDYSWVDRIGFWQEGFDLV